MKFRNSDFSLGVPVTCRYLIDNAAVNSTVHYQNMLNITERLEPEAISASEKRQNALISMTYRQLHELGRQHLEAAGLGGQQVKNMGSALNVWIEIHGYTIERQIGEEFFEGFDAAFMRYCDVLTEGRALRTQKDRQEQMLRWHRLFQTIKAHDTLPDSFAEALSERIKFMSLTLTEVARKAGLPLHHVRDWAKGVCQPSPGAIKYVPKLEALLGLQDGTLMSRLPLARRSRYQRGKAKEPRETSYTKIRRQQIKSLGAYAAPFDGLLLGQWKDLLAFKSDPLRDHARARNTWRLKSIDDVALRVQPWMIHAGRICATAGVHWAFISSYLGWLSLPRPQGAGRIEPSGHSLAWLANAELVIAYSKWAMARSNDKYHNGINAFLQIAESHLRPMTGFVWLRHDLANTLPDLNTSHRGSGSQDANAAESWQSRCESARKQIRLFRERAADTLQIRPSRNPTERPAVVLNDIFPLKRLVEFTQALERSAPPPAHHRDYIAWLRDVVMCKMLQANPLRASQYASMTWREDGSGHLVRLGNGQYQLRFDPSDFKNEKGAARSPYVATVDHSVAPWIDRYLAEARPFMSNAGKTDRFLLPAVYGPRKEPKHLTDAGLKQNAGWTSEGLSKRLTTLTAIYIPDCPGFGPHSYRHIIATDHLRRHPGDYLTVATLLHDELATVLKAYGHLKVDDGLRHLSCGIQEATLALDAEKRGPPFRH
ncbi:hypothetical protein LNV09_00520 [Paucibacter sp. B2R-40]|uniref:hypothetical protein n=1 Tax=Paucibacter sp. B2R-40 TaxID=2893554 RepID=UPI0021E3801D|nr:hypothetical protein [Paucibacter sp. B2R-40]MCV2352636.1 hypothetical protein [Paucibacter sp. B2R-40]